MSEAIKYLYCEGGKTLFITIHFNLIRVWEADAPKSRAFGQCAHMTECCCFPLMSIAALKHTLSSDQSTLCCVKWLLQCVVYGVWWHLSFLFSILCVGVWRVCVWEVGIHGWVQACGCYGSCVAARWQPWASVLTFSVVHRGFCQESWPPGFWVFFSLYPPSHWRSTFVAVVVFPRQAFSV